MTRCLLAFAFTAAVLFGSPRFWGGLEPGPHAVGFRTEQSGAIAIWYPATAQSGRAPMRFSEYLLESGDLRGLLPGYKTDRAILRRSLAQIMTGDPEGADAALIEGALDAPMFAVRDLVPSGRAFPLILWAPRYGTTAAQAVICEFLASRGYVVAVTRDPGAQAKLPFELPTAAEKRAELARMVESMRRSYAWMRKHWRLERDRVATFAFSYSGEAALGFQQQTPAVKLVASLSSNVAGGWVFDPEAKPNSSSPVRVVVLQERRAQPVVQKQISGDQWSVEFTNLAHGSFNSLEGMMPSVLGLTKVQPFSKAGPEVKAGYEAICETLLRFLDDTFFAAPTRVSPLAGNPGPLDGLPAGTTVITAPAARTYPTPTSQFEAVSFRAPNGVNIAGDLYRHSKRTSPTILLLHQSGSSRGEYRQIAPRLVRLGYNALAIDGSWGNKDRWWEVSNGTAAALRMAELAQPERMRHVLGSVDNEMAAALDWLRAHGFSGPILVWGSSISAMLQFDLVRKRGSDIAGVISFSPGFYMQNAKLPLADWFGSATQPTLIVCGWDELETSKPVFEALRTPKRTFYRSERGRHASSILYDDPGSWVAVEKFLRAFRR